MAQDSAQCRKNIVELLELFASEKEQLSYEKNVPRVDITAELICMWFNDSYHPTDKIWRAAFTEDELDALSQFHRFYDERVAKLPESRGTVRTWLTSPIWRDVMEEAQKTLEQMDAETTARVKDYFKLLYAEMTKTVELKEDEFQCFTCKTVIHSNQQECPSCGWKWKPT